MTKRQRTNKRKQRWALKIRRKQARAAYKLTLRYRMEQMNTPTIKTITHGFIPSSAQILRNIQNIG